LGALKSNNADVIGDDPMAVVMEPGRKSRLAGARFAHEGHCSPVDLDRIGMEWKQSPLM
jgi:hypothetical protein